MTESDGGMVQLVGESLSGRTDRADAAHVRAIRAYRVRPEWFGGALVLAFGIAALARWTNAAWTAYSTDSFTMQYDSLRVTMGKVPYRDFFSFPTPGTLWLQGAVFRLFGARSLNAIYLTIAVLSAFGVGLYALTFQLTKRWLVSCSVPLFVICALMAHFPFPYHHWYAAACAILVPLLAAWWFKQPGWGRLALVGAACALAGLFDQSEGAGLIAAVGLFLVVKATDATGARTSVGKLWRWSLAFGVGVLAVVIPVALYFLVQGGLRQFVYDSFLWPSSNYGARNATPLNGDLANWLYWGFDPKDPYTPAIKAPWRYYSGIWLTIGAVATPVIATLCSVELVGARLWGGVRQWRRPAQSRPARDVTDADRNDLLLLCSLLTIVLVLILFKTGEKSMMHMVWATLFAYPTMLGFVLPPPRGDGRDRVTSVFAWTYGARLVLLSFVVAGGAWYGVISNPATSANIDTVLSARELTVYVREHTAPDDQIAMFTYGGPTYFYGRQAAIGYTLLLPGLGFNTPQQFKEVADDVQRAKPKLVIFQPYYDWYDFFYANPEMLAFAHDIYGYDKSVMPMKLNTGEGAYTIYTRK